MIYSIDMYENYTILINQFYFPRIGLVDLLDAEQLRPSPTVQLVHEWQRVFQRSIRYVEQ